MIFETHNKQFSLVSATVCCGLAMCLTEPGSCGVDIHGPAPLASQVKALCLECMRGFEHTVTFDCSFRIILATRVYTGKASCHIHSRPCYSHATPRYNHATPCYTMLQPYNTRYKLSNTCMCEIGIIVQKSYLQPLNAPLSMCSRSSHQLCHVEVRAARHA